MKKILIIGARGQLGSYLSRDIEANGFDGKALTRDECDITDNSQIVYWLDTEAPDVVINTASYNVVPRAEEEPVKAMNMNFMAVRNLADECKKRGTYLVTYSTDYVFSGEKKSPYVESDTPHPLQIYGMSKLSGEYAALSLYPEGVYIVRTSGLYGGKHGSKEKGGNFILNILQESKNKKELEVGEEHTVTVTYAKDLSSATLQILQSDNLSPGIYHLVNEGDCSWYEVALEIVEIANLPVDVKAINRGGEGGGVPRPLFSALKNTRAKKAGISLPHWKTALREYMQEITM